MKAIFPKPGYGSTTTIVEVTRRTLTFNFLCVTGPWKSKVIGGIGLLRGVRHGMGTNIQLQFHIKIKKWNSSRDAHWYTFKTLFSPWDHPPRAQQTQNLSLFNFPLQIVVFFSIFFLKFTLFEIHTGLVQANKFSPQQKQTPLTKKSVFVAHKANKRQKYHSLYHVLWKVHFLKLTGQLLQKKQEYYTWNKTGFTV